MRITPLLALVASLTLSACSGLGGVTTPPAETPPETPAVTYPAYETFDTTGLDAEPPAASATIVHDVPPVVMAGRVRVPGGGAAPAPPPQEPTAQQVEGFRVQLFSSPNRDAAERVRGEAVTWWEGAQSVPSAPRSMETVVAYLQPYYRVRMGAFASRAEADAALALVRQKYPEAFLVPDLVTVMR